MSYGFAVRKVDGALVLDENAQSSAHHVPDGAVFVINGHEPAEGMSTVASLSVTLTVDGKYRADARSSCETKRT